jgi:gas vesicle protein
MKAKGVILGFVSGAAIGAATALLFAPQKGKYLRADITRKAVKTADDVNDYLRDATARASEAVRGAIKKTAVTS